MVLTDLHVIDGCNQKRLLVRLVFYSMLDLSNMRADSAVRKLFRQWKSESNSQNMAHPTLQPEKPTQHRALAPARPTWPWEHSADEDKSPGRVLDRTSRPAFLEPAQRYRILCRSRNTPNEYNFSGRPELILLAGLILVVVIMTVFDMVVVAWRG
jgi:hypothetical protein